MKCPKCDTEMKSHSTGETLVGYEIFDKDGKEHHHNDNCLKRYYHCPKCAHMWIESIVRSCEHCDWKGKDKCFCHAGMKVAAWTDPPHTVEHEEI